jgi:tetratricopeptide (TPR) repeat protein
MAIPLAALLSLLSVHAYADCASGTSVASASCAGVGKASAACRQDVETAWTACQNEYRKPGEPFPPFNSNSLDAKGVLTTEANPTLGLYHMRIVAGLATYPELRARGAGAADADYWARPRESEGTMYSNTRSMYLGLVRLGVPSDEAYARALAGAGVAPPARGDGNRGPSRGADGTQDPGGTGASPAAARQVRATPGGSPGSRVYANAREQDLNGRKDGGEYRSIGSDYLDGGDIAGATRMADAALALDPYDAGALALRARARMLAGDRDGAFKDARRALAKDPSNKEARALLGGSDALSASEGKIGRMKLGLEPRGGEAGALGPGGLPETGGGRGPGEGRALAEAAPLPAPSAGPLDGKAAQLDDIRRSALRYAAVGDWASALREASRLVSLAPEDPQAWLLRAGISAKMGNWVAAESDARRALALKADDPAALLMLGRALVAQGKLVDGLAVIERALALQPRNALAHLYRGEALEKLGRRAEAVKEYELAAALDAGLQPVVDEALARLRPSVPAAGKRMPPLKRAYRLLVALLGTGFLLKGLHFLVKGRAATRMTVTTRPPMRREDVASLEGREPAAGDVLDGNFRVERELARGGMGVVYLATDLTLRRPVAIKRLHRDALQSEDTRRKFLQEAQLAARLKHPNMAQIHSVFGERELHLVFELVEGQTLDALLAARGRLGLEETRAIVRQVCRVLEHAHAQRVIHRDLKPANVMLSPEGACKVMDFGIAHQARGAGAATMTQAWGTPPYMAPEQEEGFVSPASDLYSLAVLAYELLSGRRPFDGPGSFAAKRAGTFKPLAGEQGLGPAVDAFFARALHPDAALRFTTAADFRAAFDRLSGVTPVRAQA